MKKFATFLLLISFATTAFGQGPTLKLPKTLAGKPGAITVTADTNCKKVTWKLLDAGPTLLANPDPKSTYVIVVKPGKYKLMAIASLNDEQAEPAEITIDVQSTDPIPEPGPLVPPIPPPPPPVPVIPPAPLVPPKDDPVISLPSTLKAQLNRPTFLTASTNGTTVKWVLADDTKGILFSDGFFYRSNVALFLPTDAGDVKIFAYTAISDAPSSPAVCLVSIASGPVPVPPTPIPNPPTPAPTPVPVAGKIFATIIFDPSGKLMTSIAKFENSSSLVQTLESKDCHLRIVSKNDAAVNIKNNKGTSLASMMPPDAGIIFQDATGKIIPGKTAYPLPNDETALLSLVNDIRNGKK